jgi:hypothetical protein
MSLITKRIPSRYNHPLYKMGKARTYDAGVDQPAGTAYDPKADAEVVSSQIVGTDEHIPMLDIDMDAVLLPSSTPGHHHLYIDKPIPWKKYKNLMKALADAGIIEEGYYTASVKRGYSALRMQGVKK